MSFKGNDHFLFCRLTGVKLPKKKTAIERHVKSKKFQFRLQKRNYFFIQLWLKMQKKNKRALKSLLKRLSKMMRTNNLKKFKKKNLKKLLQLKTAKTQKRVKNERYVNYLNICQVNKCIIYHFYYLVISSSTFWLTL